MEILAKERPQKGRVTVDYQLTRFSAKIINQVLNS